MPYESPFPTKTEFIERTKEACDKIEFYRDWADSQDESEIMSDYTGDSLYEDEQEYVKELSDEELWDKMFDSYCRWKEEEWKKKVPMKVIKRYMNKKELKELEWIKEQKVLEAI